MSAVQAQKKPGGAGVKLFQAIKAVNQGCSVTLPSRCRHAAVTLPLVDFLVERVV